MVVKYVRNMYTLQVMRDEHNTTVYNMCDINAVQDLLRNFTLTFTYTSIYLNPLNTVTKSVFKCDKESMKTC